MNKYPSSIIILHWLTAFVVFLQIVVGFLMEDFQRLFYAHVAIGILLLVLVLVRLTIKFKAQNWPQQPARIKDSEFKMAKIGHFFLYVFLCVVPITGLLAALTGKEVLGEVHATLVFLFMALIAGHVVMLVKHWYFDKENLLRHMM